MSTADLLQAQSLGVGLDSESGLVRALDGVSVSISRGETFALVGESGCGKSMTALALMRLLPDNGQVHSGQVRYLEWMQKDPSADVKSASNATELLALPESTMRAYRGGAMGIIFQEPSTSLNPVMKVGDQIVESIEAHTSLRGAAARAKAIEWLQRVGIPDAEKRIDTYPFQMSGGQKQRVMIAIALAAEPKLLIADEPTTALDVTIQAQILDLLKDLQREFGMGLLLITHDLAVVRQMADRVALMYAGQIIESGSAKDFFESPQHPYAKALLKALPDAQKRGSPLAAISGTVPSLTQSFSGCRFAPRCPQALPHCTVSVPDLSVVTQAKIPGEVVHEVRCVRALELQDASQYNGSMADRTPIDRSFGAKLVAGHALLSVKDLRVSFTQRQGWLKRASPGFVAVDGVSFDVAPAQTVALVGESGCGKTTTGKALMRLLDRVALVEGEGTLAGQDLLSSSGTSLLEARRQMQIIFQDPFASLNPRMRVGEILAEGMQALRPEWSVEERQARIATLVERVGLRKDAQTRWPHEFSGGQRQRIAIARALAVEPKLIICDEPTSALDVSVQAQILNLLAELQREMNLAYLFITHNFAVVEYFADHICVMKQGRVVEQGSAQQVLGAPQDPYTQRLLAAVPRL